MNLFSVKKNKKFGFVPLEIEKRDSTDLPLLNRIRNIFNRKKSSGKFLTGFALAEMLVYISIMTVISIAMIDVIVVVTRTSKQSYTYNNIKNSAISGLERVVRDTKSAISIDMGQSVLNSSNGVLFLNSKDSDGNDKTIKFYLNSQTLKVDVNGSYVGPLTLRDTRVLSLIFTPIDTGNSKAIRIKMVIEGGAPGFVKNENFYSSVILRGSY